MGSTLANRFASLTLHAIGWRFEGDLPDIDKYVTLAVPHTSNWDGLLLLWAARSRDLPIDWMIKNDWVKGPVGAVLRRLGAVAVERSRSHNMVDQMVREFKNRDRFVLVIPPEGTRGRTEHWKSGFYHIALQAGVPVVPGYLDYSAKRAGLGPAIHLTGNVGEDMDKIRAFYDAGRYKGYHSENCGPIALREELTS